MKKRWMSVALVVLLLFGWAQYSPMILGIATGYTAKQLCSTHFVAELPDDFIWDKDVYPRMEVMGPLRSFLSYEVDEAAQTVSASLLGNVSTARYLGATGCTLNATAANAFVEPRPNAQPVPDVSVPAELESLYQAAFAEPEGGGRNTLALLVMHKGQLIAERYAGPVTNATPMQAWSMNKSLMATWVGMQSKAGMIDTSLRVKPRLMELNPESEGDFAELSPELTLLHFMAMSTGLDFEEKYTPGDDVTRMLYLADVAWEVPASTPHKETPGNQFRYSSGDTNVVSYLWQSTLDVPYWEWIDDHFSQPLALDDLTAEADVSGVQVGSSYLYMTPRDWLKVGEFWRSSLADNADLLPDDWMSFVTTPQASSKRKEYGLGFWLNNGGVAFPDAPHSLFYAGGNSGQFVVVLPEQELVVVRLGLSRVNEGMNAFLSGVVDYIESKG